MSIIDVFYDQHQNMELSIYTSYANIRKSAYREHKHVEFELSLILDGSGIYKTENGSIEIEKGDIFLFTTNEFHCITDIYPTKDHKGMDILNLHISPSFFFNHFQKDDEIKLLEVFTNKKPGYNRLNRDNKYHAIIVNYILEIQKESIHKNACYRGVVEGLITQILTYIYRYFNILDPSIDSSYKYYSNIIQAVTYINNHFTEKITLDEIIEKAYMNKTTFISAFKNIYHMCTWDYINIKRIDKALLLLRTTNKTVLQIAFECGYNSTASFNKIFKEITTITPKEYRETKR